MESFNISFKNNQNKQTGSSQKKPTKYQETKTLNLIKIYTVQLNFTEPLKEVRRFICTHIKNVHEMLLSEKIK